MYLYISKSIIYNSDKKNLCIKNTYRRHTHKLEHCLMHAWIYIYMSIIYEEHHVHIHEAIISCNYIYIYIYIYKNIIYNGIAHILKRNLVYNIYKYIITDHNYGVYDK